jgi:hypothetical protein
MVSYLPSVLASKCIELTTGQSCSEMQDQRSAIVACLRPHDRSSRVCIPDASGQLKQTTVVRNTVPSLSLHCWKCQEENRNEKPKKNAASVVGKEERPFVHSCERREKPSTKGSCKAKGDGRMQVVVWYGIGGEGSHPRHHLYKDAVVLCMHVLESYPTTGYYTINRGENSKDCVRAVRALYAWHVPLFPHQKKIKILLL